MNDPDTLQGVRLFTLVAIGGLAEGAYGYCCSKPPMFVKLSKLFLKDSPSKKSSYSEGAIKNARSELVTRGLVRRLKLGDVSSAGTTVTHRQAYELTDKGQELLATC